MQYNLRYFNSYFLFNYFRKIEGKNPVVGHDFLCFFIRRRGKGSGRLRPPGRSGISQAAFEKDSDNACIGQAQDKIRNIPEFF